MSKRGWFEVDRKGLAEVAKRRGMAFIVTEPVQNAWDEDITECAIQMTAVPGKPQVELIVTDDSPDGFRDMADSYMMFRQSYKLANPEQRGRFNIGEKLLLAVAVKARITSTTGCVIFSEKGRTTGRTRLPRGSTLQATLKMTREELDEAVKFAHTLIPPPGIKTWVNGHLLTERVPLAEGTYSLDTEVRGEEGGFKYTTRRTILRVYEVLAGETAHMYEMGIPVDEIECPWHVEVAQKIPLSMDRSSVRYGFRTSLEQFAAEIMSDQMTEEQTKGGWVSNALAYMDDEDAVRRIVKKRFGDAVIYDPSSPESNKLAIDAGYTLVHGGELSKAAWNNIKGAEALKPAGQLFDDGRVEGDIDGVPQVEKSEWTPMMRRVADYAGAFAEHVLGHGMRVIFYDDPRLGFEAFCCHRVIALNAALVSFQQQDLDALLIHECAHDKVSDHLTHAYHRECCRIGALVRTFTEVV